MNDSVQAIVTVLSLVNPAVSATIFQRLEQGRSLKEQRVDATKGVLAITGVLVGAALVGAKLLSAFGVSLDAFSVAGGAVLAWMGFGMLRSDSSADGARSQAESQGPPSLSPLVLFAASPGTITGVITLSVAHTGTDLPVTALVAIAVASLVTWVVLALSSRLASGKKGLVQDLVPKLMGLIVLAMGIQFGLTGLKSFMAG